MEINDKTIDLTVKDFVGQESYKLLETRLPVYKSQLWLLGDDYFVVSYTKPMPNWWWRMWQYLLFGFKWKKIGE